MHLVQSNPMTAALTPEKQQAEAIKLMGAEPSRSGAAPQTAGAKAPPTAADLDFISKHKDNPAYVAKFKATFGIDPP
jgi:hypothetical protein